MGNNYDLGAVRLGSNLDPKSANTILNKLNDDKKKFRNAVKKVAHLKSSPYIDDEMMNENQLKRKLTDFTLQSRT